MTRYAVHNLAAPPIPIDDEGRYAVAPDGPRYHAEPLRVFDTREEAEEWRVGQIEGVK